MYVYVYTCLATNSSTSPNGNGINTLVPAVSCKENEKKCKLFVATCGTVSPVNATHIQCG